MTDLTDDDRRDVAGQRTHSVEFDWDRDSEVSGVVLSTVANASGRDITDLPPLHNAVNVDALNKLFRSRRSGNERTKGSVTFLYAGFSVTVYADGLIVVREIDS